MLVRVALSGLVLWVALAFVGAAAAKQERARKASRAEVVRLTAEDYIKSLERQRRALELLPKASWKVEEGITARAAKTLPIASAAIDGLRRLQGQAAKVERSDGEFRKLLGRIDREGNAATAEVDDLINDIIGGGGISGIGGGGDGSGSKPDCSAVAQGVNQACARGVQIKQSCGYYSENGGASAVEEAFEKCNRDAQAAVLLCVATGDPMAAGFSFEYEAAAYATCSQMESDKEDDGPAEVDSADGNV